MNLFGMIAKFALEDGDIIDVKLNDGTTKKVFPFNVDDVILWAYDFLGNIIFIILSEITDITVAA